MIPRIQTGTSFKGVGLYYLHDKKRDGEQERLTSGRLAWTYALNTLEDDPEAVLAEMRQTAFDQTLLKQLSGNRVDGRPTERTVMTVALAWSPEQHPDQKEMIEAGKSFLKHMGWDQHQALLLGHNDTKHPHFHMIINRVHPETGMTLDDNWSKTRSQKWALAYEREHGHIYCEAREAKYTRDERTHASHMNYREWKAWKEINKENAFDPEHREVLEAGEWTVLKQGQQRERTAFWKQTGQMRQDLRGALRESVREEFAGDWYAYSVKKAERMEKVQAYDKEARRTIRTLRKQRVGQRHVRDKLEGITVVRSADGTTHIKQRGIESAGIEQIKERQKAFHAAEREELWKLRSDISKRQIERLEELVGPALEKLSADRSEAYKDVLARHRAERATLRDDQETGTRRQDLLGGLSSGKDSGATPLTAEQTKAYIEAARNTTARQSEFATTRPEVTDTGRGRSATKREEPAASSSKKEATERSSEERDKGQKEQSARRQAEVENLLAKRAHDRARDRGGGGRQR
jgi:hypothetical protein